jgi:thiamine-phosphate pyrophosphorylase
MKPISKLHFITTNATTAELACKGGVNWVQLRLKNVKYEQYKKVALEVQEVCSRYNAVLIINDNVQLAADIGADGVHIGSADMTPAEARALLGNDFIIGCTANTYEDIVRLSAQPINYIGLGPFRYTTTKQNLSPVLGIEGYKSIINQLKTTYTNHLPIIAIGGIIVHDVLSILATEVHGIAVSGAIGNASDVRSKAADFVNIIDYKTPISSTTITSASNKSIASKGIGEIVITGISEVFTNTIAEIISSDSFS